jgi:ESCRT-II complex subunit VPS22
LLLGGIIAVTEVCETLNRKKTVYSVGNIPVAGKKLGKLGRGFRIIKVRKLDMIVSVPTELDQDHMEIMTLAQDGEGCVTVDDVMQQLSGATIELRELSLYCYKKVWLGKTIITV